MSPTLNVALIQANLSWENKDANLQNFARIFNAIPKSTDLILLPEMFTSGFTMHPNKVAETMDGPSVQWMQEQATKHDCYICGSLVIKDQDCYYNRMCCVNKDGIQAIYNKRHLFALAQEHLSYTPGEAEQIIVDIKGFKCLLSVCYDLRFPVWLRNQALSYDIMLCAANWPQTRILHWDVLLQARAIENLSYVVAVNRIGKDGNQLDYSGHSAVYHPSGKTLVKMTEQEEIGLLTLDKMSLDNWRKRFPFHKDQDNFNVV